MIVKTHDVFCDTDGCIQWTDGFTGSADAKKARRIARGRGWTYTKGRDLCPAHSASITGLCGDVNHTVGIVCNKPVGHEGNHGWQ